MDSQNMLTSEECDKVKLIFIQFCAKILGRPFEVEPQNKAQINAIFSILVLKSTECTTNDFIGRKIGSKRGFFIFGDIGIGKSSLMRLTSGFLRYVRLRTFRFTSVDEICTKYKLTGDYAEFTHNENGITGKPATICIDELGREPRIVDNYGTKLDVISQVIQERYTLWQTKGIITHFVSNLNIEELSKVYGEFISDRIVEMCNIVRLSGESKRF